MLYLGVSSFYHDSAICLLQNGEIKFASQEERFSRIKNDPSFPSHSLKNCLEYLDIKIEDIDEVIFYEKPFLKFERLIKTYADNFPLGIKSYLKSIPLWGKEKLFQRNLIKNFLDEFKSEKKNKFNLKFSEHHLSHAASAFYPSPYQSSSILTIDGVGEFSTTTVGFGNENEIDIQKKINYPDSVGLLYSAFTYYLGFKVNSDEYKVMGLAPYGEPIYFDLILKNLIDLKEDGSFKLNQDYFSYSTDLVMTNKKFDELFEFQLRKNNLEKLTKQHMDIAASIQKVTEYIVLKICRHIKSIHNSNNLCLAGGVALNCVANGKILREGIFDNIWIQPAAGDAGGALGAAYVGYFQNSKNKKIFKNNYDLMNGSYLGTDNKNNEIKKYLIDKSIPFEEFQDYEKLCEKVAGELENGQVVGWIQGRAEYGPRALGHRSILADPRKEDMQKKLNLKIKFRESFRPFAPIVMKEYCHEYFDIKRESPYMLIVDYLKKDKLVEIKNVLTGFDKLNQVRSKLPSITHVDNSARIQTVDLKRNEKIYKLLDAFYKKTGCPVLINTSFNLSEEPIVNSYKDAVESFKRCGLDKLVINNFYISK